MNQSESITKLSAAIVAAQAEMPVVAFDKDGFNYRYATLGAIWATLRPILAKHNLAVIQLPVSNGDGFTRVGVQTRVIHESGEYLEDKFFITPDDKKNLSTAQQAGVAITYARRYSIAAFFGIVTDEDTDAQLPTGNGNTTEADKQPVDPPKNPTKAMTDNFHRLGAKAYGDAWDDERKRLTAFITRKHGHESTSSTDLTSDEMATLIRGMQSTIDSREQE